MMRWPVVVAWLLLFVSVMLWLADAAPLALAFTGIGGVLLALAAWNEDRP